MKYKNKIVLSFATSLILANSINANDVEKLETVTVTAQKTEENVQEVPISMSVFDEFTLKDRNINEVKDIAKFTPGLDIIGYTSLKYAPSMRGLSSEFKYFSSVAGLYIDGVPITDGTGFDASLMDIERIEVLKGPQGTLYGKNTEVGVINVITKKPDNETRAKVGIEIGEDNKREYSFSASGPIIKDKFYIGISGKHYEKDGFVQNRYTNKNEDDQEYNYGKINLRWTPTDDLEASFVSSKVKYDTGSSAGLTISNYHEVASDLDTYIKPEVLLNALTINYSINDKLSLSSTTAHREYLDKQAVDFDYKDNYARRFHAISDSKHKTLSEELKLNYENDNIKLVSGIFAEKEDNHIVDKRDKWWLPSITTDISDREMTSIGLFSHLTYKFNDKLSLLGGLRYDKVDQEYTDSLGKIENSENEISPKLGLTYKLSNDMITYATISKGYRAGGFNASAPSGYSKTFNKETLYSYELGLKGTSLDNRLSYDMAIYHMDITDMQTNVYLSASNAIKTNAAEATSQGLEASLNFQVTNTLNLFAGFSYNNIEFDKYYDGTKSLSGNRTELSPKYDFNLGALYRADNGFYVSADISGYGDMYLDNENDYKRDAYELVNTKLGYETEQFDIYLYGNNIFDKEYDRDGVFRGFYTYYSQPREIGVQLAYRF